jgi:2-polyprenyl-3-methyl-5-hydroxy-6-metoxy-1,4-benzoquinol methylase
VDVALIFDVLEHVERPDQMLAEVNRIVRPGGLLVAFIPIEGERFSWAHHA